MSSECIVSRTFSAVSWTPQGQSNPDLAALQPRRAGPCQCHLAAVADAGAGVSQGVTSSKNNLFSTFFSPTLPLLVAALGHPTVFGMSFDRTKQLGYWYAMSSD